MFKPIPPKDSPADPEASPLDNPAIARCFHLWESTQLQALAAGKSEYKSESEAAMAYRAAMPPLSGAQNIADYVACVGYALNREIIGPGDAQALLEVVKIALAAIPKERKAPVPAA